MSNSAHLNIPISFNQVIELVRQLPKKQQEKIVSILQKQDDFSLSNQQTQILDNRSKTPLDQFIPSDDALKLLKKKHGL